MTGVLIIAGFVAIFIGFVLLLQAAFGGEPDPTGANAALRFLDPAGRGPRHPPERNRRRLAQRGAIALVVGAGLIGLIALS